MQGATPLHWAASCGRLGVVAMLLTQHADANVQDTEVTLCTLHLVLEQLSLITLQHMHFLAASAAVAPLPLYADARLSLQGHSPLHLAVRNGHTECVERLLLLQVYPNCRDNSVSSCRALNLQLHIRLTDCCRPQNMCLLLNPVVC